MDIWVNPFLLTATGSGSTVDPYGLLANWNAGPGDTVKFLSAPKNSLSNWTFTSGSKDVTIPSGLIKNIDDCEDETSWTASANVTLSAESSNYKYTYGTQSIKVAVASGFTTGKLMYKGLGSTEDFSSFNRLNIFVRSESGVINGKGLKLNLCSDTTGDTVVDSIDLGDFLTANSSGTYTVNDYISVDAGTLGSSIQSVSLSFDVDPGAVTFMIDCIFASDDTFGFNHVVRRDHSSSPEFYCVKSAYGTSVELGRVLDSSTYSGCKFGGDSGTNVAAETILCAHTPSGSSTSTTFWTTDNGSFSSLLTYSGGWSDPTGTPTQDSYTFFMSGVGRMDGIDPGVFNFYEKLGVFGSYNAIDSMNNCKFDDCHFGSNRNISFNGDGSVGTNIHITDPGTSVVFGTFGGYFENVFCVGGDNDSNDINIAAVNCLREWKNLNFKYGYRIDFGTIYNLEIRDLSITDHASHAIFAGNSSAVVGKVKIYNLTTSGNLTGMNVLTGDWTLVNPNIAEATDITITSDASDQLQAIVRCERMDGTPGYVYTKGRGFTIQSDTGSDRRTASGKCWKFSPTDAEDCTEEFPSRLKLGILNFTGSNTAEVKVWVKRSNTGINMKLNCPAGQIAGVSSEVSDSASGSAGTYEELSISISPTEEGAVEIYLDVWGGSTYNGFADDFSVVV